MYNEYTTHHVSYNPWSTIWCYKDGRRIAHYRIKLEELEKGLRAFPFGIKRLKVKKEWKCDVCDKIINKNSEAVLFKGRYDCDKWYVHKECINFDIK